MSSLVISLGIFGKKVCLLRGLAVFLDWCIQRRTAMRFSPSDMHEHVRAHAKGAVFS